MTTFHRNMVRTETEQPHFHVSMFQVGCLNDSDNGPFESAEDAIGFAEELVAQENDRIAEDADFRSWSDVDEMELYTETGTFDGQLKRWQCGTYVIAVEQCEYALRFCGGVPRVDRVASDTGHGRTLCPARNL